MQNPTTTLIPAETSPLSIRHFSTRLVSTFLFFGALWFILCRHLSGEWSVNDQYGYGWFVPFFALYLFWLRWEDRPMEGRAPSRPNFGTAQRPSLQVLPWIFIGVLALLLLLPIRLFEIGNPDWRPLSWLHAAAVTTLTLLYIWYAGGAPWLRHFAFPVLFIFIAVPWVTPIEVPIIQGLMRVVAAVAAETVTLFGIPTQLEGNLIRVTNGLVGVNEACSGVRSLQTSLMIGLLFGELKRLSILRRAALVGGAVAIAIAANLCRAVFLVWIAATKNISEVNSWHDIAGYTIVALVSIGTLILATLLGRGKADVSPSQSFRNPQHGVRGRRRVDCSGRMVMRPSDREIASQSAIRNSTSAFFLPTSYFLPALCWLVAVELGTHFWYRAHESNLVATTRWDLQWPQTAPNFRELKIDEDMRRILRFDQGHAAAWTWPAASSPDASPPVNSKKIACLLYLFRWNPGQNSVLLANLHRPDVCLPATGWHQVADTGVRNYPVTTSFALPFRHFEFRRSTPENSTPQMAHAFYCLTEDRVPTSSAAGSKSPRMTAASSTWTRNERVRQVLEGRRHLGQQVMEFVLISSWQIPAADAESRFGELVHDIVLAKPAPDDTRENDR